jgi:hypothetical protein
MSYDRKGGEQMTITFTLYSASGLMSTNTLTAQEFAEFRVIAESLKQSVRIQKVMS